MNAKKISTLVIAVLSLVNMILSWLGLPQLVFDNTTIYTVVSAIITVISWLGVVWFNFNFTDASKAGQLVINKIKSGEVTVAEVINAINNIASASNDLKNV